MAFGTSIYIFENIKLHTLQKVGDDPLKLKSISNIFNSAFSIANYITSTHANECVYFTEMINHS